MDAWRTLGLIALIAVVILTAVSFGAATGRLRRETRIGLWSKALLRSDRAWDAGHRAALSHLVVADLGALVVMIGAMAAVEARVGWSIVAIIVGGMVCAAALVRGQVVADRAAKMVGSSTRRRLQ